MITEKQEWTLAAHYISMHMTDGRRRGRWRCGGIGFEEQGENERERVGRTRPLPPPAVENSHTGFWSNRG